MGLEQRASAAVGQSAECCLQPRGPKCVPPAPLPRSTVRQLQQGRARGGGGVENRDS